MCEIIIARIQEKFVPEFFFIYFEQSYLQKLKYEKSSTHGPSQSWDEFESKFTEQKNFPLKYFCSYSVTDPGIYLTG